MEQGKTFFLILIEEKHDGEIIKAFGLLLYSCKLFRQNYSFDSFSELNASSSAVAIMRSVSS